jgi:hypothetical protein
MSERIELDLLAAVFEPFANVIAAWVFGSAQKGRQRTGRIRLLNRSRIRGFDCFHPIRFRNLYVSKE